MDELDNGPNVFAIGAKYDIWLLGKHGGQCFQCAPYQWFVVDQGELFTTAETASGTCCQEQAGNSHQIAANCNAGRLLL